MRAFSRTILGPLVIAAFFAAFTIGCDKDDDDGHGGNNNGGGAPGPNEVWMQNNAFTPGNLTVSPGTAVRWINRDGAPHTVTGAGFDSGNIGSNGTFTRTFDTPGTFSYHCEIHSGMSGVITVQ